MAPPRGVARLTLTSPSEIDRLFKQGRRVNDALLVLIAHPAPQDLPRGRVLFVAGKKLGGAVFRNRCKRVLREACRRAGGPWPGSDVALVARAGVATATCEELDQALGALLRRNRVTDR